jgi:lambda repressor-like predicted transcriptional regulator
MCYHQLLLQNLASASTALRELHAKSGLALAALAAQIGAPLSPLQKILAVALITQEVHNRLAQLSVLRYITTATATVIKELSQGFDA